MLAWRLVSMQGVPRSMGRPGAHLKSVSISGGDLLLALGRQSRQRASLSLFSSSGRVSYFAPHLYDTQTRALAKESRQVSCTPYLRPSQTSLQQIIYRVGGYAKTTRAELAKSATDSLKVRALFRMRRQNLLYCATQCHCFIPPRFCYCLNAAEISMPH